MNVPSRVDGPLSVGLHPALAAPVGMVSMARIHFACAEQEGALPLLRDVDPDRSVQFGLTLYASQLDRSLPFSR